MTNKKVQITIVTSFILLTGFLINAAINSENWRGFWLTEVQITASAVVLWFLLRVKE